MRWHVVGPHRDGSATVVSNEGRIICALMPREAKHASKIAAAPDLAEAGAE